MKLLQNLKEKYIYKNHDEKHDIFYLYYVYQNGCDDVREEARGTREVEREEA